MKHRRSLIATVVFLLLAGIAGSHLVIQFVQTSAELDVIAKGEQAMRTKRLTELALPATIALTVFTIELRIPNPFPIPGVRLGLANIITVYALYHYRAGEVLMVLLARIFLGALFAGSMMSLLYSLAGGMLCLAGMLILRHVIPEQGIWSASVIGAVLHNAGQIAVAIMVTGTVGVIAFFRSFWFPAVWPVCLRGCAHRQ